MLEMRLLVRFVFFGFFLSATATFPVFSQTDQTIYTDSRQNSWQDWGWATTINYANTSPVHSGSDSIRVTLGNPWEAIYIAHTAFDSTPYTNLTFWINGGPSGGQQLLVQGHAGGNYQTSVNLAPLAANTWQKISISLAALEIGRASCRERVFITV